jgi:hypothetical protein
MAHEHRMDKAPSQRLQRRPLQGPVPGGLRSAKNACDLSMLLPVVRLVRRDGVGPCQHGGVAPHRVRPLQHRRGDARPTLSVLRRRCEEAVACSHKPLGAEVPLRRRFQDSPEPPQPGMVPPGAAHTVMQTSVRIGATTVLASDGPCGGRPSVQGFARSLTVPDEAKAE